MRTTIVTAVAALVPVAGALASLVPSATSITGLSMSASGRHGERNAAGDTVGTDIVVFNDTSSAYLTNWPGIATISGGPGFATNSVTSDEIEINAVQSDLGGGLFEYRFGFRNSNSASGLNTEFTPGGDVSLNGGAPSKIIEHSIQIGTLAAFDNNIDSILGAALSIPDINGASMGNGITTIYFDDNTTQSIGFFAAIDGTGVDGSVFISANGADLGDFGIVGYDVRFQVQYIPAPVGALALGMSGLFVRRRR